MIEIGYKDGLRWAVGLQEQPAADGKPGLTLDSNTVFLVTGAAGSIVSAITADLATASGGTFYLLDLVPEPDPANPDLKGFVTDKDGLKRDLFARIQARGERATPALVEKELAALERAQAACNAIEAVRAAGGTAHYFSVNLTDADAVTKIIKQVRERSGRVNVLLHAAGTERSHFLPDKDAREFDLVFDVKSDGSSICCMPSETCLSGRRWRSAQSLAASATLDKLTTARPTICCARSRRLPCHPAEYARHRRQLDGVGGVGMATRGSIPRMMELAGIDMLPPEAGIPFDSPRTDRWRDTRRNCCRPTSRCSAERVGCHRRAGYISSRNPDAIRSAANHRQARSCGLAEWPQDRNHARPGDSAVLA